MTLDKEQIKEFFYPAFKLKKLAFIAVFISAIVAGFEMYSVNLLKDIINLIELKKHTELLHLIYFYVGLLVLYYIFSYFSTPFTPIFFAEPRRVIYDRVIERFIKLDNNISETVGTGKFIAILEKGIITWGEMFNFIFREGSESLFKIILGFYIMHLILPSYFMFFFFLFIIVIFISYIGNKGAVRWRRLRKDAKNKQTAQLVKITMSKFEILQNGKINKEIDILKNQLDEEKYMNIKAFYWIWFMYDIPMWVISIIKIGIIFVVGVGVIKNKFSIGEYVALSGVLIILEGSVQNLISHYKDFTKNFPDIEKLFTIFKEIPCIKGYDTGNDFKYTNGDIELKNVSFSYGNEKIFDNFDLTIKGGTKVALVGVSGSGKTTLAKLIAGYLYADDGIIQIDGQNLSETSLKSYYKHIGYLTQDPSILDASILENLIYGADEKNLTEEKIKNAIKMAECDFIDNFKNGIQTEIGERGVKLSGGQKQRLAIAKIFLKNPEIIILDEPTSALDSFSEEKITKAFHNLFKGRTVIIIAHRLQTVREADDIIVFEKSTIIERGDHNCLIGKGGLYSKMLSLQGGIDTFSIGTESRF